MIEILILMIVIALISGAGQWATKSRLKRQYQEKYGNCCGSNCGCHSDKKKEKTK